MVNKRQSIAGPKPLGLTKAAVLARMKAAADPAAMAGKARYGIDVRGAFGLSMPFVRGLAREIGRDQKLAVALWNTGIPECRLLAPMIAVPGECDDALIERWVSDLRSWDVCDGFCSALVSRLPNAWDKALAWSGRDEEFVRRAGFATMAWLTVHARQARDKDFRPFLRCIEHAADDSRNMVKKAVNWALRQIGKRNPALREQALAVAERLAARESAAARWIGKDALRELRDPEQVARIRARGAKAPA